MQLINKDEIQLYLNWNPENNKTDLCDLLVKYGSDKCSDWHNYSPLYNFLFSSDRRKEINLFEIGIYGGGSIRAWKEYFENSNIYCGDVNREYFINEDRIRSFYCDQDSQDSINDMWKNNDLQKIDFDIIIDDGKHEFIPNYNFLVCSIAKLKKNGIFIVEDLTSETLRGFKQICHSLKDDFNLSLVECLEIKNASNKIDNNILLIQK
jgi:hypothetical protein